MNVLFVSLGCDKNRVDSEYMLGELSRNGFDVTDEETRADIIVVNTCCFIRDAKQESIDVILEMASRRTEGRCRALIVCGCLAERYRGEILREIPEVDALLGTASAEYILDAVRQCAGVLPDSSEGGSPEAAEGSCRGAEAAQKYERYEPLCGTPPRMSGRVLSTGGHYAYLKIAEGCDRCCSYCVIPSIRGPYRSVPMEELVAEAELLADQGVRELILIAQETTLYGADLYGEKSLHRLLRKLALIGGIRWIRLMYCHPQEICDELVAEIRDNDRVCHYIDMPIQHVSADILNKMGRHTDRESLAEKISVLRAEIPDIAIRTTLISGFPGETKEQHGELMDFVREMAFDRLGVFTYSREEGTKAEAFPGQLSEQIKSERRDAIMRLEEDIIADRNTAAVGEELDVLIEGLIEGEDAYVGRSYRDAPDIDGYVFVRTDRELMTGDFIRVEITGAHGYDLIGEPV